MDADNSDEEDILHRAGGRFALGKRFKGASAGGTSLAYIPVSQDTNHVPDSGNVPGHGHALDRCAMSSSPTGRGQKMALAWLFGRGRPLLKRLVMCAAVSVLCSIGIMAILQRSAIFDAVVKVLDALVQNIGTGFGGGVVLATLVFASAFPPIVGYGWLLFLCGYALGFPLGIAPAYTGALAGAVACFALSRTLLSGRAERFAAKYPLYRAVKTGLESGGLPLLLLLRLAPYPFALFNCILATTRLSFRSFIFVTALSLVKVVVHVYIGSRLHDVHDVVNGTKDKGEVAFATLGLCLCVIGGVGLYVVARRKLSEFSATDVAISTSTPPVETTHCASNAEREDGDVTCAVDVDSTVGLPKCAIALSRDTDETELVVMGRSTYAH
eukprot:Opistho-2@94102